MLVCCLHAVICLDLLLSHYIFVGLLAHDDLCDLLTVVLGLDLLIIRSILLLLSAVSAMPDSADVIGLRNNAMRLRK